jgi:RNA polymerase sigma factor (TIGR02999 family)
MQSDVTLLLSQVAAGEEGAASRLLAVVYEELRTMARQRMAALPPGQTLQPTALVHEAFVKLLGDKAHVAFENRRHFFGAATQAMREIIVDASRRRTAQKRGGGRAVADLSQALAIPAVGADPEDVLAVDRALSQLAANHPRAAEVVTMRYFAGLSVEEIAESLGVTTRTIEREWRFARAYLHDAIAQDGP